MRVAIYVRVSTTEQLDGLGLDVQEASCRKWAKANDARVVAVLRDEGLSGTKSVDERPGLAAALAAIQHGEADALLIPSLHRLARRLDVQEAALAQAWRYGGRVYAVDTGEIHKDDPDDPMRTFIRQVLGAVGELERGMIAARLKAARDLKRERGGFGGGGVPFGFRTDGGELVADDDGQDVLRRIGELRHSGRSLREIATTLDGLGIAPPRGPRWHPTTVNRIARRLEGVTA